MNPRTCVGCRQKDMRPNLVRLVATEGGVVVAPKQHSGRGAWIHPEERCCQRAKRTGGLARALRVPAADLPEELFTYSVRSAERKPETKESGLEADGHPMSTQR